MWTHWILNELMCERVLKKYKHCIKKFRGNDNWLNGGKSPDIKLDIPEIEDYFAPSPYDVEGVLSPNVV